MADESGADLVREAVGVLDSAEQLEAAIDELLVSGFDRADVSLMASEEAVEEKLGHKYEKVSELEDEAGLPRTAYVSRESLGDAEGAVIGGLMYVGAAAAAGAIAASGGTLAGVIVGAAAAGGGGTLIGSLLARWIDRHHARYLQEQLDRGGLLLWVRTWTPEQEERAKQILGEHSAHDVHVHPLPTAEKAEKEVYLKRVQAELGHISGELDALKTRVEEKTTGVGLAVRQELDAISEKQATTRREIQRLSSTAGAAWRDVREGVDKAYDDLRKAVTHARARFG